MHRHTILTPVAWFFAAVACGGSASEPAAPTSVRMAEGSAPAEESSTDEVESKGRLPPDAIQKVVRQGFPTLEACYRKAQEADHEIEGRISFSFTITEEGNVANLDTSETSFEDQALLTCMNEAFQALEFPKPEGGVVTVRYPIIFSPNKPESGAQPDSD